MDICFKALQHETTGEMVSAATQAPSVRTRPAVRVLPRPPIVYGDFALLPWAWLPIPSTASPAVLEAELDVAA